MGRRTRQLRKRLRGFDGMLERQTRVPRATLALIGGFAVGLFAALSIVAHLREGHEMGLDVEGENLVSDFERLMTTWDEAVLWIARSHLTGSIKDSQILQSDLSSPDALPLLPGFLWFGVAEPHEVPHHLLNSVPPIDPSVHEAILSQPEARLTVHRATQSPGSRVSPPFVVPNGPCEGRMLLVARHDPLGFSADPSFFVYSPVCLDALVSRVVHPDRRYALRIRAGDEIVFVEEDFEPSFSTMLARSSFPFDLGGETWTLEMRSLPFPFSPQFAFPFFLFLGISGLGLLFFAWTRWEERDRRLTEAMLRTYRLLQKQTHFLAETSRLLAWHTDKSSISILPQIAARAVPILGTGCGICLLEDENQVRVFVAHADPRVEAELRASLATPLAMPGFQTFLLEISRTHGRVIPEEAFEDMLVVTSPASKQEFVRKALRWCIAVPMIARGRPIGAVVVRMQKGRRYGPRMVRLIHDFGSRIAMAIDNSRLVQDLQRAVRVREEFLSIASHELLTPVTALQTNLQSLMRLHRQGEDLSPERLARGLDVAERQVRRLAKLVHELLDVSRIEAGKLGLHLERFDLSELVEEMVARYEKEAERLGCELTADCPPGAIGSWDRHRIEQVVTNLLSNALKYGRSRPVHVEVREDGEEVLVRFRDQGVGIPEEALGRIFSRFERAVEDSGYGGLGLGLFIAQRIVDAHHGRIEVQSVKDEGSVFTLRLPRERPDVAPPPAETEPIRESMH